MKKIILNTLLIAAFSTALVSCNEKYEPYEPAQVVDGCYGVYFPEQDAAGSHVLDPSLEASATFTAKRTNTSGAITVPVQVQSSVPGIFSVSPLEFADGEDEATFTVTFPDAEIGPTYRVSLVITDPQYADVYNYDVPVSLDYSVRRLYSIKADFTLGWWGENHNVTINYYELSGVRYCSIDGAEECDVVNYDSKGNPFSCGGGLFGNGYDFEFTWNVETGAINVPSQGIAAYSSSKDYCASGWYEYWTGEKGYTDADLEVKGEEDFYKQYADDYGQSFYKDGVFYFNLKYYVPSLGGWNTEAYECVGKVVE